MKVRPKREINIPKDRESEWKMTRRYRREIKQMRGIENYLDAVTWVRMFVYI